MTTVNGQLLLSAYARRQENAKDERISFKEINREKRVPAGGNNWRYTIANVILS